MQAMILGGRSPGGVGSVVATGYHDDELDVTPTVTVHRVAEPPTVTPISL